MFKVNAEKFGVKSTFKTDMSQYTTPLNVKKLSAEQVRKATRVAKEINDGPTAHLRHLDIEEDAEGDFIYQKDADTGASLQKLLTPGNGSSEPVRSHIDKLETLVAVHGAEAVADATGGVSVDGGIEALASHLTNTLAKAAKDGGDSPSGALAQRMRELVVAKSWADLLPQLELSKTLQGIVADMGVEPEATVESVVSKLLMAKRWQSPNMLQHHQILETIGCALLEELLADKAIETIDGALPESALPDKANNFAGDHCLPHRRAARPEGPAAGETES